MYSREAAGRMFEMQGAKSTRAHSVELNDNDTDRMLAHVFTRALLVGSS